MDESAPPIEAALDRVRQQSAEGLRHSSLAPYAAAWAVLALQAHDAAPEELAPLREFLGRWQLDDGRVVIDRTMPDVYWPTALAILAWGGGGELFATPRRRAAEFLLSIASATWKSKSGSIANSDPSIQGWSWLATTYAWVEPTSLAVMALQSVGEGEHARVGEAIRLLLDRQLPDGGWNYGSKEVFQTGLPPIPEDTGYALAALAGSVESERVEGSLQFLETVCRQARTPSTLAWAINGLSAWGQRPASARQWITESLELQRRVGAYDIRLLSQLVVSFYETRRLADWVGEVE